MKRWLVAGWLNQSAGWPVASQAAPRAVDFNLFGAPYLAARQIGQLLAQAIQP